VTLLGNEFHSEIELGTKEYKKDFVCAKGGRYALKLTLLWRVQK